MHETKEKILQTALQEASLYGLESLSIGQLAKSLEMSKSGLFAHFQSRENLQIAVLKYASQRFVEEVLQPAFKAPRGIPRIRAVADNWLNWTGNVMQGDCPILASLTEMDEKQGPVRDCLFGLMQNFWESLLRMAQIAKAEGHFAPHASEDLFAFEWLSLLLAYQATRRLHPHARELFLQGVNSLIQRNQPH